MTDKLKCPVCGGEMETRESPFGRTVYWMQCGLIRTNTNGHCVILPERKTKRGAINAARRLLEKMKGGK